MRSPVPDDAEKSVIHVLPWVRDARRQDETRRLQEEVIEVAQCLKGESDGLLFEARAQPSEQRAVGFHLGEIYPVEETYGLEEMTERIWAPLRPEQMLPPPQETRLPGLGLVAGLVGAVGVAAAIAFVVANVVPILTTSDDKSETSQLVSALGLGSLPQIEPAQAAVQSAEATSVPLAPMPATTPTNAVTSAMPSAAARAIPPKLAAVQPEATIAPNAAVPERTTASMTRGEMATLLRRGRDLVASGDIASGRLILTHLAEAGNAEASFLLAGTFDPAVLAKLRVFGVKPDPGKARAWYARAAQQGSTEAMQRLQQSAPR